MTLFALVMYIKCLYQDGFIDKSDLNKETQKVVIKSTRKKKQNMLIYRLQMNIYSL